MTKPVPIPARPESLDVPRRYWGDREPPKNRADMFSMSRPTNAAAATPAGAAAAPVAPNTATLRLYGPIDSLGGWWGISARDVAQALDDMGDDVGQIVLRINSPGGDAWEGLAILNMLRAHPANVTAVVDGIAASAASYIAAGADETVMSPGTQMMIHDAIGIAVGPPALMRKSGTFLDSISNSIASLYSEAAGGTDADWRALMVDETWFTAQEAVKAGLANRVGVVPDVGQAATPGEDAPDPAGTASDVENRFDLSVFMHAGRSHAPAPRPLATAAATAPSSPAAAPADGSQEAPPTKEGSSIVAFSDASTATLRQKLGVSDDADEATILAAFDEAMTERAEPQNTITAALPEGVVAIDATQLSELRAHAEMGRQARLAQEQDSRERVVNSAIADGRIAPVRKDAWLARLAADPEEAVTLNSLEAGLVPVTPRGFGAAADVTDDQPIDDAMASALAAFTGAPKEAFQR